MSADLISTGMVFQSLGATEQKARSPVERRFAGGIIHLEQSDDHKGWAGML